MWDTGTQPLDIVYAQGYTPDKVLARRFVHAEDNSMSGAGRSHPGPTCDIYCETLLGRCYLGVVRVLWPHLDSRQ